MDACLQRAGGYRVVGYAETGEDAEALAEKFQPDIVLLDLRYGTRGGRFDTAPGGRGTADDDRGISARRDPASSDAALSAGAFAFVERSPELFESGAMARLLDALSDRFADVLAGNEAVAPISVDEDGSGV